MMYTLESMGQETSGAESTDMAEDVAFSYLSVVQMDATKNEVRLPII